MEIDDEGAEAIAARSRGTPRVANRLLKRARDFAEVRGAGPHRRRAWRARRSTCSRWTRRASTGSTARSSHAICEKFGGGPVGLSTLAVAVGEEPDTIEDVYEPYLLQQGFIMRTPRGRVATDAAYAPPGPRAAGRCGAAALLATVNNLSFRSAPTLQAFMPIFICPNCGDRSLSTERTAGFQSRARALQEVRLRLPVRAARRLLPGSQRRLLHARPAGPADRHRAGRARADRPR